MEIHDKIYIGGQWLPSAGLGVHEVVDSNTEDVVGKVPEGTEDDVERAVDAAAEAFFAWSSTAVEERAKLLDRVAEGLKARGDEIAATISREVGMPKSLAGPIQVGLPVAVFTDAASQARALAWEEEVGNSLMVREPVGVVGAITPWNYPLYQIALKVAAALAAGCTVVLKPSEIAPLNAFALAEVIDDVGLPPGVFNLVSGPGAIVGEAIASHPKVDMVSFTGSTRAGKRVMQLAARVGEEGRARARRQVGQRPARGRRRRHRGAGRPVRVLPQLRADLLGPHPDDRPARGWPRSKRRPSPRSPASPPATRSPTASWSAHSSRPPSATGCAGTSSRASTKGPSC